MNIAVTDDMQEVRENIRHILAEYAAANHMDITVSEYGSGIGLASIRTAAERYGGTVSFRNEGNEFISGVVIPMTL